MKRLLSIWLRNWPIQRLRNEALLGESLLGESLQNESLQGNAPSSEPSASSPLLAAGSSPVGSLSRERSRLGDPSDNRQSSNVPGNTELPQDSVGSQSVGDVRPIILWQTDPRRGRQVVACCDQAKYLGVRTGIAIAQATELVLCNAARIARSDQPSVAPIVMEHDRVADHVAIEKIASALQAEISPLVAIETLSRRLWSGQVMLQPDTLFCDLSGVTHLFENEPGILAAAHRCLNRFGVVGKLAIADNPTAAWAHAHCNRSNDFISNEPVDDLVSLSVDGLRIESDTKYTLDRLGIQTIGALLRLPRAGLARRLGEPIVQRIAEVLGEVDPPLKVHHAEQQYWATHTLEYPTDDLQIVADRIERLAKQLVAKLAKNQRGALRLVCHLELLAEPPLNTVVGLFAPTQDQEHLAALVNASVETLKLPAEITKLSLMVLQSGSLRTSQSSLFANQLGGEALGIEDQTGGSRALARLVDGLTSRMGRDAVLGIRSSDNPLPEKAYRTYSLTDHRTRKALRKLPRKAVRRAAKNDSVISPTGQRRGFRAPKKHDARRRPMKLLRSPVRLKPIRQSTPSKTASNATSTASSPLPSFQLGGELHRVAYYWGPERIETGWWSGPTVRRDYYRIETDTGRLWWVYQDLRSKDQWYLHGRYS